MMVFKNKLLSWVLAGKLLMGSFLGYGCVVRENYIPQVEPSNQVERLLLRDNDGDGYGGSNLERVLVGGRLPEGYALVGNDCDDDPLTGREVYPGAREVCDGRDNDCDSLVDEDFLELGEICRVGEGVCEREGVYGCGLEGELECSAVPGSSIEEVCDGLDNDCDGLVDDDCGEMVFQALGRGSYEVRRVKGDGKGLETLVGGLEREPKPEWCGGKVVFVGVDLEGMEGIRVLNVESGEVGVLSDGYEEIREGPRCSPDGGKAAFVHRDAFGDKISLVYMDGRQGENLVGNYGVIRGFSWCGDDKLVFYSWNQAYEIELGRGNVSEYGLNLGEGFLREVACSPDGGKLAMVYSFNTFYGDYDEVFLMEVSGGGGNGGVGGAGERKLTDHYGYFGCVEGSLERMAIDCGGLAWSGDSGKLGYVCEADVGCKVGVSGRSESWSYRLFVAEVGEGSGGEVSVGEEGGLGSGGGEVSVGERVEELEECAYLEGVGFAPGGQAVSFVGSCGGGHRDVYVRGLGEGSNGEKVNLTNDEFSNKGVRWRRD